jgi:hypothetical protein
MSRFVKLKKKSTRHVARATFDANASAAEDTLRRAYGVKVNIKRQPTGKGEMKFTFTNDEEFEALLDKLNKQ